MELRVSPAAVQKRFRPWTVQHAGHSGRQTVRLGATGILTCLDAKTGAKIGRLNMRKQFEPPALTFGVSTSPLVAGDKVLVNVGAKGASVVAFNKDSGDVVWKASTMPPAIRRRSWAAPAPWFS